MAGLSVYDGILNPGGGLVTPQSQVDEMYRGIYQAPSNVSRVTPEGLNVNKVQTVAVDPFTGNPIRAGGTPARAETTLSASPGRLTASDATHLPPANYGGVDLSYAPSASVVARTVNPDGSFSDPLTAIDHATTPKPVSSTPGGAWGGGWGADAVGRFLAGDPGATDWGKVRPDNGQYGIPAQGFATIPNGKPTVRSVIAARQPVPVRVVAPHVAAALAAQAPNYAGGGPVTGVQQGTSGYTIYNGDNGVPGNSGNWFNQVTGRG